MRAWDQGIWSDGTLSSFKPFFVRHLRSHSSVPTRMMVRPPGAAAVKDGPLWGPPGGLLLDGREHDGMLECVGIVLLALVVDGRKIRQRFGEAGDRRIRSGDAIN